MALDHGPRTDYVEGAKEVLRLLEDAAVAQRWSAPSILEDMPVSGLAGHLALSIFQVEWFLDTTIPETERVDAVTYYARLSDTHAHSSRFNRRIRERGEAAAADGPESLARQARAAADRLEERLVEEPRDRVLSVQHRPGETMFLDEYLRTRCVEMAVHIEDLALSIETNWRVPDGALAVAIDVLFRAALQRHGASAVLRAMTRRERDGVGALRVL